MIVALRILMLRRSIDRKREELSALETRDSEFSTREAELETAIQEAETSEQEQAVSEEIDHFEEEKTTHEEAKTALNREIQGLEADLAAAEAAAPQPDNTHTHAERMNANMPNIQIRSLPMNQRAFDALPLERRSAMVAQEDVKTFFTQLRSMKGQQREAEPPS